MKATITGPRQYSVLEAAEYVGLHPQSVYDLVRDDLIDHHRKGRRRGRIYFFEEDLTAYLTGNSKRRAKS